MDLEAKKPKQWTVFLKPHTIWEKLRWWIRGKLPIILADELKLGPNGLLVIIDIENDRSWMEWGFNIQSWTCNYGFKESEKRIKEQNAADRKQESLDTMYPFMSNIMPDDTQKTPDNKKKESQGGEYSVECQ